MPGCEINFAAAVYVFIEMGIEDGHGLLTIDHECDLVILELGTIVEVGRADACDEAIAFIKKVLFIPQSVYRIRPGRSECLKSDGEK